MAYLDPNDPYAQPYPTDTTTPVAPRQTGPVTDPNDPRLSDPSYSSDPNVLAFLNSHYGAGGTALTKPPNSPGWDPITQTWLPGGDDPGPTPTPTTTTTTTPTPTPTGPAPTPVLQSAPTAPGSGGAPAYTPPPAFSYDPFVAPTADDLKNDQGYQFEFNQGLQAIGAKNAALGTLNTGGTIKDFQSFGDNLASTKYNDLWNRKANEYAMNRGNAVDAYNTNYGTQYKDPFSFGLQGAELNQNNNQFNAQLGTNTNQYNSNMDWQKFLQTYKSTVTDPFQQKISLLGLL